MTKNKTQVENDQQNSTSKVITSPNAFLDMQEHNTIKSVILLIS